MAVIEELIRVEDNGSLSFGNYMVESKKKVVDFEVNGDLYYVKTYNEITTENFFLRLFRELQYITLKWTEKMFLLRLKEQTIYKLQWSLSLKKNTELL